MGRQRPESEDKQRDTDHRPISATDFATVGTNRTAAEEGTRIPVLSFNGQPGRHERVSPSQDDSVAQVSGNPAGRVPRLPALQCFAARRIARSTEDNSGEGG